MIVSVFDMKHTTSPLTLIYTRRLQSFTLNNICCLITDLGSVLVA